MGGELGGGEVGDGGGKTGEGGCEGGGKTGVGGDDGDGGDDGGDATTRTSMCEWTFAIPLYARQKKYNPGDRTLRSNAGNWFASPTSLLPSVNCPEAAASACTPHDSMTEVDAPFIQHSRECSSTRNPVVPIDSWNATGRSVRILDM